MDLLGWSEADGTKPKLADNYDEMFLISSGWSRGTQRNFRLDIWDDVYKVSQ